MLTASTVKEKGTKRSTTTQPRQGNPYEQGSRYYDLWQANPYSEEKRTRRQTVWDMLANFFGFRSGYDIYTDQANMDMAAEDARIEELKGQDEYNSAQEVAKREKAAGINSDLVGLQGEGAASEARQAPTQDMGSVEFAEKVGNIMNGVAQGLLMAVSMTGEIGKTIGLFRDNTTKKIANVTGMQTLAEQFLEENIGADMPGNPDHGHNAAGDWTIADLRDQLLGTDENDGAVSTWAKNMGLNARQTRQLKEHAYGLFESHKDMTYKQWRENLEERKKYGMVAGSKYTPAGDDFGTIMDTMKPLLEFNDKYIYNAARANAEDAENKAEYNEEWSGTDAAKAENEMNKRQAQQAKMDKEMKKAFAQVMDNLTKKAEAGSQWAFFATLILPMIYEHLMNGSVTVGQNKQGSMEVQSLTL